MYDPSEGRFIQEDSFRGNSKDPLSLNLYTYCVNNPMVYDDQNGHWTEWISKAWNVAKDIASSALNGIKQAANTVWGGLKWIGSVVRDVAKGLLSVADEFKNDIASRIKSLKDDWSNIKDRYTNLMNQHKKVNEIIQVTNQNKDAAVNFFKQINVQQLLSGGIAMAVGIESMSAGGGAMGAPVPGGRIAGIGLLALGVSSFLYGTGEVIDSTFHTNPIKDMAEKLGMSEEDYNMLGFMSTFGSSVGAGAVSPYISNGSTPNESAEAEASEGAAEAPKYKFGDQKKFDKHFDKHVTRQGEFGNITQDEYLQKANTFIDSTGKDVLTRTSSNGDILKFNTTTNEFSIVTKDGTIRTYHKLDPNIHGQGTNMDYWNGPDCNY